MEECVKVKVKDTLTELEQVMQELRCSSELHSFENSLELLLVKVREKIAIVETKMNGEIFDLVESFLSSRDLLNCRLVSKKWQKLATPPAQKKSTVKINTIYADNYTQNGSVEAFLRVATSTIGLGVDVDGQEIKESFLNGCRNLSINLESMIYNRAHTDSPDIVAANLMNQLFCREVFSISISLPQYNHSAEDLITDIFNLVCTMKTLRRLHLKRDRRWEHTEDNGSNAGNINEFLTYLQGGDTPRLEYLKIEAFSGHTPIQLGPILQSKFKLKALHLESTDCQQLSDFLNRHRLTLSELTLHDFSTSTTPMLPFLKKLSSKALAGNAQSQDPESVPLLKSLTMDMLPPDDNPNYKWLSSRGFQVGPALTTLVADISVSSDERSQGFQNILHSQTLLKSLDLRIYSWEIPCLLWPLTDYDSLVSLTLDVSDSHLDRTYRDSLVTGYPLQTCRDILNKIRSTSLPAIADLSLEFTGPDLLNPALHSIAVFKNLAHFKLEGMGSEVTLLFCLLKLDKLRALVLRHGWVPPSTINFRESIVRVFGSQLTIWKQDCSFVQYG